MDWLSELGKDNRGSRPRCVLLTDGGRDGVAARLTGIVGRSEVVVLPEDQWQPQGAGDVGEAELDKAVPGGAALLPEDTRLQLRTWWLAKATGTSRTPNWDIASTCTMFGRKGLLLVEAKAHSKELSTRDRCGATPANRNRIERALAEANAGLREVRGGSWELSAEHHYQISNRFAWSWKLATLGVPVVLVYLGFLDAAEMEDKGVPFASGNDWKNVLLEQCCGVIDASCWERTLEVEGTPLLPVMRTVAQPFDPR